MSQSLTGGVREDKRSGNGLRGKAGVYNVQEAASRRQQNITSLEAGPEWRRQYSDKQLTTQ